MLTLKDLSIYAIVWAALATSTALSMPAIAAVAVPITYVLRRRPTWALLRKDLRALGVIWDHLVFYVSALPLYIRLRRLDAAEWERIRRAAADDDGGARDVVYDQDTGVKLDVYAPSEASRRRSAHANAEGLVPVVIYIYGGAWSSGDKLFYSLLGVTLRSKGLVTIVPNYRLYPAVKCEPMLDDLTSAYAWVRVHAREFGGDPLRVMVVGHSAGGHLASLLVLRSLAAAASFADLPIPALGIKGVVTLGSPFDIRGHFAFERRRGVEEISAMRPCMGGEQGFDAHSPTVVAGPIMQAAVRRLSKHVPRRPGEAATTHRRRVAARVAAAVPWFHLIHSTHDTTVAHTQTTDFHSVLVDAGLRSTQTLVSGVSHSGIVMDLFDKSAPHHSQVMALVLDAVDHIDSVATHVAGNAELSPPDWSQAIDSSGVYDRSSLPSPARGTAAGFPGTVNVSPIRRAPSSPLVYRSQAKRSPSRTKPATPRATLIRTLSRSGFVVQHEARPSHHHHGDGDGNAAGGGSSLDGITEDALVGALTEASHAMLDALTSLESRVAALEVSVDDATLSFESAVDLMEDAPDDEAVDRRSGGLGRDATRGGPPLSAWFQPSALATAVVPLLTVVFARRWWK